VHAIVKSAFSMPAKRDHEQYAEQEQRLDAGAIAA
jgi:hypothetical protein